MRKLLIAASVGAALMAPVSASASLIDLGPKAPPAIEIVPGDMSGRAAALTKVTSEKALTGVKRVAIGQFQVEFVKRSLGLTRKERNQTTVTYEIETPMPDTSLQAQTDKLYQAFVDQLTAAGFEVVPRATMMATAAWPKLAAIAKPSPAEVSTESGKGMLTNAFGDPYYYAIPDPHLGGMGSMTWGFTMGAMKEQALAAELDAAVVDVRLVVGFKETDKHNDMFAIARVGSSFVGNPRLVAQAVATGLTVTAAKAGPATITLNSDLLFPGETLSANMKMDTSNAQEASNIVAKGMFGMRVLGGIVPGVGALPAMKLNTAYKVACNPSETDYMNDVHANLSAVTGMLVARFASAPR
jgi:hypothetical protein